jgi:hypothetical protein
VFDFVKHGLLKSSTVLESTLKSLFLLVLGDDGVPEVRDLRGHFVQALIELKLLHSQTCQLSLVPVKYLKECPISE